MDKVVHFEIPFDNKQRAMKFYQDSFGWHLMDMQEMNYVMANTVDVDERHRPKESGAINGGLFQRPKEAPNTAIYVGVSSIAATLKKVTDAGGRVVTPETPIPGMGAYARVADTEGNVIGIFRGQ